MYLHLVISTTINVVSWPFIVLFNALLIFYIIWRSTLRRKKSIVVLGYLAVTDLAVGVIVQPVFIATQLCRIHGPCNMCVVDSAFYYLVTVTCGSSISHLTLVAWERCVAIKHTLRYRLIVTTNRLVIYDIVKWLLHFALNAILLFGFKRVYVFEMSQAIAMLILIAMIMYFYTVIYLESRRHRDRINATNPQYGTNWSREKEFKAAKTTALIVGCLLTCYIPTGVALVSMNFIYPLNVSNSALRESIISWQCTIVLLNSLLNPLIYGCRLQEIRELLKGTLQYQRENNAVADNNKMVGQRVNPGLARNADQFVTGVLAHNPGPPGNPSEATKLRSTDNRETSVHPNTEPSEEHGCVFKPTFHTSQTNEFDDVDSESGFEMNTRF